MKCFEMLAIPKKQGTRKCQEYRRISQNPAVNNKQKAKQIHGREHTEEQYGFRRGMIARGTIGVVRTIGVRCTE